VTLEQRRVALGLASALVAVVSLITATAGAGSVRHGLGLSPAIPSSPPPPVAVVTVSAGGVTLGEPSAPVIYPLVPVKVAVRDGTLRGVKVLDTVSGRAVSGGQDSDSRSWSTTGPLSYSDRYWVSVDAVGTDGQAVHRDVSFSTVHPASLTGASVGPDLSSVGVGQPLVVRFNHPIVDKASAVKALAVTTSPAQPGAWYWISSSEVHYRGPNYWQPGTTIKLSANLFGIDLGRGAFGQANNYVAVHVHDSWVAKADGASETMQIFHNGQQVNSMPISLGSAKYPSHIGPHVISDKQPSIIMDSCSYGVCPGQPGYYKEKVDLDERISNDGEFVHSAPWSVGQQGDTNVSHGCVNLSPDNARWFYNTFGIGDVVEITNSSGPKLPIYDTYGDWEVPWGQWSTGNNS
jgi:lipoprotein-anchoring transpeptidase ErfK/SrfK